MHVLPLHAEVEGGIRRDWFVKLMDKVVAMGYQAVPLGVIHAELAQLTLPVRKYRIAMLAGRAAPCAI
jgi:undecaprenyl phosphate-alpha-L-ara4FN deformylase